jgi:hypothetical protein
METKNSGLLRDLEPNIIQKSNIKFSHVENTSTKEQVKENNQPDLNLIKSKSQSHENLASATVNMHMKIGEVNSEHSEQLRKSQNLQEPMKRAQSVQNISHSNQQPEPTTTKIESFSKRSMSTQNISNKHKKRQAKIANSSQAYAYNAQLLASFEKEKRAQERRISELIQIAEHRKTDNERLKYQVIYLIFYY